MRPRMTLTTCLAAGAIAAASATAAAATNIDANHKDSWGENIGWMNWRDAAGGASGVSVMADHLTGMIWTENEGWISAGAGAGPYANTTGLNYGVNIGVGGALRGYAWGENTGWINFDTTPTLGGLGARYDAGSDRFRGYAWGENIGWINLDDAVHFVAVDACTGDLNGDGQVNSSDLALLLGNWGMPGVGDLNGDSTVNASDLALMLGSWGPC